MIDDPILAHEWGNFVLNINRDFLWRSFTLATFVYIVFTLILLYHWQRYGMRSLMIFWAQILYFVSTVLLLFFASCIFIENDEHLFGCGEICGACIFGLEDFS